MPPNKMKTKWSLKIKGEINSDDVQDFNKDLIQYLERYPNWPRNMRLSTQYR